MQLLGPGFRLTACIHLRTFVIAMKKSPNLTNAVHTEASGSWLRFLRCYLVVIVAVNLAWETIQLPLYTIWMTGTLWEQAFAVLHCTLGDLLIALAALTSALVIAGDDGWPTNRFRAVAFVAILFGFGYTIFSEWLNVVVRRAWSYSEWMPVISAFGLNIGASPLLQWIVVPLVAFRVGRRTITKDRVADHQGQR